MGGDPAMMWGGGWWIIGLVVMVAWMYLMARMMMGLGESGHGAHRDQPDGGSNASASDILAERFARGEISEEEFHQRMRVLQHRAS